MKSIVLFIALVAGLPALVGAQLAYNSKGKVHLLNGSTVSGEVQFKPAYADEVEIKPEGESTFKKYSSDEVKSFELDSVIYEPKKAKGGEIRIKNKPVFMEAVANTSTGLNLYIERFQEKVKYALNIPLKSSEIRSFWVSIPGNSNEVYDPNSTKFIPKFDDKVSAIVASCPALAEKVSKKEKGYFYNLMNQNQAPEIWARIVLEFAACK